jgi:hypothetical protein
MSGGIRRGRRRVIRRQEEGVIRRRGGTEKACKFGAWMMLCMSVHESA